MKIQETTFILQAIDIHDYPFYYFKDKYALDMLSYYIEDEDASIKELRQSAFGHLLQKPLLKKIMSALPGKKLRQDQLMGYWNGEGRYFKLSLSQWGEYKKHRKDSWYQTSRPGYNLVLQINFDWAHDHDYYHKMQPYFKLWDEATLAASIWFLKRELGINNIYYNTYETGNFMKRLHYSKPPRSLYTQLPRQFGFRETSEAPHFLKDEPYLKKTFRNNSALKWYVLKF